MQDQDARSRRVAQLRPGQLDLFQLPENIAADIKTRGLARPLGGVALGSNFSRYRLLHHFKTVIDDQPGELFAVDQFDRDTLVLFVAFRLSLRLRAEAP